MAFPSSVTGFARATFPIPFVPSGHYPMTRGIGPRGRLLLLLSLPIFSAGTFFSGQRGYKLLSFQ